MGTCPECRNTVREGEQALDDGMHLKDAVCLCGRVWAWERTSLGYQWYMRKRVNAAQRVIARLIGRTVWT